MYIGDVIKKYRKDHSISMQEFATRSGLSKAYIGILEKVYNPQTNKPICPSLSKMDAIARAMGMTLDELLPILSSDQEVIINTMPKRNPNISDGQYRTGMVLHRLGDKLLNGEIKESDMNAEWLLQTLKITIPKEVFPNDDDLD